MNEKLRNSLKEFLLEIVTPFTIFDVENFLKTKKIHITRTKIYEILIQDPGVIEIDSGLFLTVPAFFKGFHFSIKPTQFEVDNNILIIGHRCVPYLNVNVFPQDIQFVCHSKEIAKKEVFLPLAKVKPFYELFGTEFIYDYLENDGNHKNDELVLENDMESSKVYITVLDLENFYKQHNFSYGDIIACKIKDWTKNEVEISSVNFEKSEIFNHFKFFEERKKWMDNFENLLMESFSLWGPCGSIEEQLIRVLYVNKDVLNKKCCGSIEEVLALSKKIVFAPYGVESRLWFSNEEIPAIGNWNDYLLEEKSDYSFNESVAIKFSEPILQALVLDSLFKKEDDCSEIIRRFQSLNFDFENNEKLALMLHLKQKRDMIRKTYNWFADYHVGKTRSLAVDLFCRLFTLTCEIESSGFDLRKLPQNELIVLSQLIENIEKILIMLSEDNIEEKTLKMISLSMEGMFFSYEEIREILQKYLK